MFAVFFQAILIIVIFILALLIYGKIRENEKLKIEVLHKQDKYEKLVNECEILRSYMDNKHLVWDPEENPLFFHVKSAYDMRSTCPETVVLMRLGALDKLYHDRWNNGFDSGQNYYQKLADSIPKPSLTSDKKFDRDYRDQVNELTKIAVRYAGAQQLRERISHQVLEFRTYMNRRQKGESPEFPKNS